jgi:hypothetical protein
MKKYLIISKDGLCLDCIQADSPEAAVTAYRQSLPPTALQAEFWGGTSLKGLTAELVFPISDDEPWDAHGAMKGGA